MNEFLLNIHVFGSDSVSLWREASRCVNDAAGYKILFGPGTGLTVQPSKFWSKTLKSLLSEENMRKFFKRRSDEVSE